MSEERKLTLRIFPCVHDLQVLHYDQRIPSNNQGRSLSRHSSISSTSKTKILIVKSPVILNLSAENMEK